MKKTMLSLLAFLPLACSPGEPASKATPPATTLQPAPPATAAAAFRNAAEMSAAGYRRYGVESGILIFRLDGAVKGREFLYFDHWGWREAKFQKNTAHVGSFKEETDKVQFLDGERRIEWDAAANTASFFDSPQVEASARKLGTKDMVKVGAEMMKAMGGRLEKLETFAGVVCEVWQLDHYKTTLHLWKGLTLKEFSKINGVPVGRAAVSAEWGVEVPEEKLAFKLPAGAKVVGLGQLAK